MSSTARSTAKARVLGLSLVDLLIDVLLPSLVAAVLLGAGVAGYLALTAGGVLVGAKAGLGRVADWRLDRWAAVVAVVAALALVVLFTLPALGVPDVVAAAAAGVIVAVPTAVALLHGRRVDGIGVLVLVEVAAGVVVTLISDDPRFVLARPAAYTAVAGVAALVSCVRGRPFMLDVTKPIAAAGDPDRAVAFETAWERDARFRRLKRAMTAWLGVVMLVESALRLLVVYGTDDPVSAASGLVAQIPAVGLLVLYVVAVRVLVVPRVSSIVDRYMPDPVPAPGGRS